MIYGHKPWQLNQKTNDDSKDINGDIFPVLQIALRKVSPLEGVKKWLRSNLEPTAGER